MANVDENIDIFLCVLSIVVGLLMLLLGSKYLKLAIICVGFYFGCYFSRLLLTQIGYITYVFICFVDFLLKPCFDLHVCEQ